MITSEPGTRMRGDEPAWQVAGRFLEALTRRDFASLEGCFATGATMHALTPRGLVETNGPEETAGRFGTWFGGLAEFAVLDAEIGQIGAKLALRWRLATRTTDGPACVIDQHAYATAGEQILALDLVCSGFQTATGGARVTVKMVDARSGSSFTVWLRGSPRSRMVSPV